MQCAKFEQRLQQLLDDRKDVVQDEELREHSRGCETCAAVLQTQNLLFTGLKSFPQSNCAPDLGLRVLDKLRADRRKRINKRWFVAALATAAVIMIALLPLAGENIRFRQRGEPRGRLALAIPAPQQSPASRLSEQESEDIRMLVHQFVLRLSDQRLAVFEPVDQLASGIRPLAVTFNFAFDALRRTLPGYSQPLPAEPQALYGGSRMSIS